MIKEIITDPTALSQKCLPCVFNDFGQTHIDEVIKDLADTFMVNQKRAVGLSANQIGHSLQIFVMRHKGNLLVPVLNPVMIPLKTHGIRRVKEACLSFPEAGVFKKRRYKKVKLMYQEPKGKTKIRTFSKLEAVIVQHEMDHLNGVLFP